MSHPYPTVGVAKPFSRKRGLASTDSRGASTDSHGASADSHGASADSHRASTHSRGASADSHGASTDSLGLLVIRRRSAGDRVQAAWLMWSANEVGRWAARHR